MRAGTSRGVQPLDVLVTTLLCALASWLMVDNILSRDVDVRIDSHSWWLLPVFLAAALPVLWWRRGLLPVLLVSCAAMAVHVVAFGALVRCGAGLPLTFVLAFLAAGWEPQPRRRGAALVLVAALGSLVTVRDTAAGVGLLPVVLVASMVLAGIGRVVAHRAELSRDLQRHNDELRLLRDDRAALEVGSQRVELSARLESLLDERLAQLATAAEQGAQSADPAATRQLLATLEDEGRRTLGDMREIVGLLRGGEVALAPVPSVAHLDALVTRHARSGRLQVAGDPRLLPASVELSAYRIVEHLVTALAADPAAPVGVGITFSDDALEISVAGPVARGSELRGAVGRARERARLHAGSLEVKVARGQARVTALLPVAGGG